MNPYRDLMWQIGEKEGIDPLLLEAISFQESSWRADAFRYEPEFYERYLKDSERWTHAIPRRISSSYGLFQIMYTTALDHGFRDEPEVLFIPSTNVKMACKVLNGLFNWSGDRIEQALAAYNGGKGNWRAAGPTNYARSVMKHYERLKGEAK